MHDLPREAVDIAIRYGELSDSSMVSRLLVRAHRVLVARRSISSDQRRFFVRPILRTIAVLRGCRAINPRFSGALSRRQGSSETVVVKPVLCGDSLLVRQWALRGDGVAYKANVDVAADLRAGRLVRLLAEYEGEAVPISAVMPSGRHVPTRVRAMVDHLAKRFAESSVK